VGVGDPGHPTWARQAGFFNGKLVADYPLVGAEAYLPPSAAHPWFLRVVDREISGSSGSLQAFAITYQGTTYQATDTPITLLDTGTAVSILAPGPGEPSLQLVAPTGGEEWPIGQTQPISWTSTNLDPQSSIQIELSRDDGGSWETLFASTPNDGSEDWPVAGPETEQARVRVSSLAEPSLVATSAAVFSILQPSITLTAPNGGELVDAGAALSVRWQQRAAPGDVAIELSRDDGGTWESLFAATPGDGQEEWVATGPATTAARIRVRTLAGALADESDATFRIQAPPPPATLTLLAPNGGEQWPTGSSQTIRWQSTDLKGTVDLELSRDDGGSWAPLAAGLPANGSHPWTVTGPPTTAARVRVRAASDPGLADQSDASFSIQEPPLALRLTAPNGGEKWRVNQTVSIRWNSSVAGLGRVKIELSTDDGQSWTTLLAATANDGQEAWKVARPTSSRCRVRITATVEPAASDTSDGQFKIQGARRGLPVGPPWRRR
jgi:hypothetical protein